ncbi:hypothetical protein FACS1894187_11670 [Synergistales bacterium]|nr:hypothetical protein FACS1894187_11670 [Synergistales bacterium]
MFANLAYRPTDRSNFKGSVSVGFIYTTGRAVGRMESAGYDYIFKNSMKYLSFLNGKTEYMTANYMYQFDDYSKYECPLFDPDDRAKFRDKQFPVDCKHAFEMGARLVRGNK